MVVHALVLLAALTVKQDQTPLRSGCDAEDGIVASLPAGTPVEILFRLGDGSDCFKIAVTVDSKNLTGYVPSSALANVDEFERQVASAKSLDTIQAMSPIENHTKAVVARAGDPDLNRASQLLTANQPAQALEILEPAVKRYPKNPDVLLLTGLAAYRADQLRTALDYWKQSLDLAPNNALERLYTRVQRESDSDHSADKLYGLYIALRYEGATLPADTARAIVSVLDEEFGRISSELGCNTGERITAIVQSRDAYLRGTGAAEWSGGQYDGRIHVSWMEGNQVGPQERRTLAHELVHACLTSMPSGSTPWPAWLQEGMAQRLSGDTPTRNQREQIAQLTESHQLPHLQSLRQDWSRLNAQNARLAYSLALEAVDILYDNYSAYGIRNILRNPQTLPQITADLDKRLGSTAP